MKSNDQANALAYALEAEGSPPPRMEYMFAPVVEGKPSRRWRFDLAWPERQLAVEIDGSVYTGGRHGGSPSAGRDLEKRNAAAVLGWRVLHFTPSQVRRGQARLWVRFALGEIDTCPF